MNLNQAVKSLPPEAQAEVVDFVAFLKSKYSKNRACSVKEETAYWSALCEASVRDIWNNEDDDIYSELLKKVRFPGGM